MKKHMYDIQMQDSVNRRIKKKFTMYNITVVNLYEDMFYADRKVREKMCGCCRIGAYNNRKLHQRWTMV